VFLAVLVARLWHLQLIHGESYVKEARENRIRLLRLSPSRGRILDSQGRVLADNSPGFTFSVIPGEMGDTEKIIETSSDVLGLAPEKLRRLIHRSKSSPKYMACPLKENMSLEQVSLIKSRITSLKGVTLETRPTRLYPFGEALCHVVGTVGEISAKELFKYSQMGYRPGDRIGKAGIEKEYEVLLKGVEGWEQIEINARGRQLADLTRRSPTPGANVTLTIDVSFQKFVEKTFIYRAGSVIVVDPDTGRIIAMVSKPGFDLNLFAPSISEHEWKNLNSDPLHPLENRSIRGVYSPASTFKVVTAAAALGEGMVHPDERFTCEGKFQLGGQTFRCWKRKGHGEVDLHGALVESCDTYFYKLGLRLGIDRIARYASLFGLGKPTGLGLPQELPGLIPTPAWKLRTYREAWRDGETVTVSIGQGYLVCSPIQLAMMTVAVANGGKLLRPALVRRIISHDGSLIFDHSPVVRWKIPLNPRELSLLRRAMIGVVSENDGTGKKSRIPGISLAGKTGTSQVIRLREGALKMEKVPYHERTHAIFIAYVDDRPMKIAVVVIVEHGGGGGAVAAPIARKIICRYYGVPDPGDPKE